MVTLCILYVLAIILLSLGIALLHIPLLLVVGLLLVSGLGLLVRALLLPLRLLNFLPPLLALGAILLLI